MYKYFIMLKNISNLGKTLNKAEKKEVSGGRGGWINPNNCNLGIYEACPPGQSRVHNPNYPNGAECICV